MSSLLHLGQAIKAMGIRSFGWSVHGRDGEPGRAHRRRSDVSSFPRRVFRRCRSRSVGSVRLPIRTGEDGGSSTTPVVPGVHCMRFRRGRIGNGMAVLAGARPDVLASAPGARAKFVALGGVLLSTGGLAAVSAAFAVHMALGVWWPFALVIGLGWGAVIVNLDRMVLVGMGHDSSWQRNLVLAVPRVGLALILGIVVATPLTLQIFHKEIDTEIVQMQAERSDAFRTGLESDARFADLPSLRSRITTAESVVASGGQTDAGLAVVQDNVTARQAELDAALATAQ